LTLQIGISQTLLPKFTDNTGKVYLGITNEQAQDVNVLSDNYDKCQEELQSIKQTIKLNTTTDSLLKTVILRNNVIDSVYQSGVEQYQVLVETQTAKYNDMIDTWKDYAKHLKNQNRNILLETLLPNIVVSGTIVGVVIYYTKK